MAIRTRKIVIVVCIIAAIVAATWFVRYPALYYYYLWRLNRTQEGGEIMSINQKIESISPHVIDLLVRTYKDIQASNKSRNAAAFSLIKANREMAETLFIDFLQNKDGGLLSTAIFNLGVAKSVRPYRAIMQFKDSANEDVRWAVVSYLGNFKTDESIFILKRMMENDASEKVRNAAAYRLQQFGIPSSQ